MNTKESQCTKSDKLIGSLAFLKSGFLENDFISTYIPFVSTILCKNAQHENEMKIESIISSFTDEFGFTIERAPMTTLLNKCAKLGIISKQKNATYVVNKEVCNKYKIDASKISEKSQLYQNIIIKLIEFYKTSFNIEISANDAETQVLRFLDENSCKTLLVNFDDIVSDKQTQKQHQYIISTFIKHCHENDTATYLLIRDLATAYLMSSAIAFNEKDEQSAIAQFNNLVIYLDTPFVLKVLGLNETSMQQASLALMNRLSSMGCIFKIFSHNYDELSQIMSDCLRWIENDGYDDFHASIALRTFIRKEFTKAELQTYIDSLPYKLKYYKISIDDEDFYAGKYFNSQIDEPEIERNIIEVYKSRNQSFNPSEKASTINFDVKSISAIFKLWGNNTSRTYSQAKYIFLTTNTTLSYIARKYLQKDNKNYRYNIYPCLTDVFLGTNIWLNAPIETVDDFSQKKLLADCMAILQPSDQLITALLSSIERCYTDKSITESQYYLLKSKAFENNYLMNRTLSDETYFSDKITEELLQDIEASITEPYKQEISKLQDNLNETSCTSENYLQQLNKYTEQEKERQLLDTTLKDKARNRIDYLENIVIAIVLIPFISIICSISSILPFSEKVNCTILIVSAILLLVFGGFLLSLKTNLFKFKDWLCKLKYKSLKTKEYRKSIEF